MRHGWIAIPNVQSGDRTLEEQMMAVRPALAEARGKVVLDMGCAEGLIGREFALAGARQVVGLDSVAGHLAIAVEQCSGLPMKFDLVDLNDASQLVYSADIVLCLGLAHKLHDPSVAIYFAARAASSLVLLRSGRGADKNGIIKSKHREMTCDSHAVMRECDFVLERRVDGPPDRDEPVEYWRHL